MEKFVYKTKPLTAAAVGACAAYYGVVPWAGSGWFAVMVCAGLVCAALGKAFCSGPVFFAKANGEPAPRAARYAVILAVFSLCGFWTGGVRRIAADQKALFFVGQAKPGVTALSGVLLDDPRVSRSGRGLAALSLQWADGSLQGVRGAARTSARGTVTVLFPEGAIPRVKEFGRGSTVLVDGRFTEDNGLFIAKGVFVVMPPATLDRLRTAIRVACVEVFAPYRWGGFALALLIGIRDNLDSELAEQYQNAGVSHILALSGMHLAIISAVIAFLLKKPLGLKWSAAIGSLLIAGYIFLAGVMPSLERSGLMYFLGAAAVILGLPKDPLSTLCLSFLLQIVIRPESGTSLSFILSYGALAGILTMSGPLYNCMRRDLPPVIGTSLAASLAAFIATMSVTAGFFGTIRPVGILCGLLLGPLATVFMVGAMLFPAAPPFLRVVIDWGMGVLYVVQEKIAGAAGRVPPIEASLVPALLINAALIAGLIIASLVIIKKRFFIERLD
ncbi:MAG: ComEC/Rec2 family competence protein [Spirochaetaceae bacterium]|jgi:competence protein ComEC|nr:ComEC/Rec2 family competence protein [Spirochaetaceae bacterium]